jgi:hypothetical protein
VFVANEFHFSRFDCTPASEESLVMSPEACGKLTFYRYKLQERLPSPLFQPESALNTDDIAPKAQFTQKAQLFANQAEIIASTWRVTHMAKLLASQANLSLLTINADGAARPMEAIVSCTTETEAEQYMAEAELILRPNTPTAAETWDLVDAQQNGYDAGLELFKAACSGDE